MPRIRHQQLENLKKRAHMPLPPVVPTLADVQAEVLAVGGPFLVSQMNAYYPGIFTDPEVLALAVSRLNTFHSNVMSSWANFSAFQSGSPFTVVTPHNSVGEKLNNILGDGTDVQNWFQDLAVAGVGGIQITDLTP